MVFGTLQVPPTAPFRIEPLHLDLAVWRGCVDFKLPVWMEDMPFRRIR
jgi:hypothetical protein